MSDRARRLWQRLEAIHGLIYFVPEADQHYTALGLDPGKMGYFASRSAAMGEVTAEVVIATFYNFEPESIRQVVPLAWERTSAASLVAARLDAVDLALQRVLGDRLRQTDVAEVAQLLWRACAVCRPEGRPLFAGHAAQARSDEPHLALWQAVTLLREYRGDGHIAALTTAGVRGCEALVMHAATGAVPATVLQSTRGWSDAAWADSIASLHARGWLDELGAYTEQGRQVRDEIEQLTDRLAADPWEVFTDDEATLIGDVGRALSRTINEAGVFRRLPL